MDDYIIIRHYIIYIHLPGTQMTSFFVGLTPPSTRRAQPLSSNHPNIHPNIYRTPKVSSPSFTDYDLDVGELGGTIGWESPEVTVTITGYRVYLAEVGGWGLGFGVGLREGSFMYLGGLSANKSSRALLKRD